MMLAVAVVGVIGGELRAVGPFIGWKLAAIAALECSMQVEPQHLGFGSATMQEQKSVLNEETATNVHHDNSPT